MSSEFSIPFEHASEIEAKGQLHAVNLATHSPNTHATDIMRTGPAITFVSTSHFCEQEMVYTLSNENVLYLLFIA